ncbi:beta family protein [Celerinatantimonas sp. MCCC 1A17872]|uniref:beta family protein n=1 Tax=Celerinatantimonas sp. MCCC 1A17872 TaxID=3177514 RepID=UPI0038C974F6
MSDYIYFPIIKTRDAELRCFDHLSEDVENNILPIYELTKSRITKKAPDGDIHRRMKRIGDIQGNRPFILDLCTSPKYLNPQIEQLLNPFDGFSEWRYFLNLFTDMNIIPMIHIYEDDEGSFKEVEKFIRIQSQTSNMLAVRFPYNLESGDYEYYLGPIIDNLSDDANLIVILDADYIRYEDKDNVITNFIDSSQEILNLDHINEVVIACTSFPSNPAKEGNSDSDGEFSIDEEIIYQEVSNEIDVKYGDYASINTEQIEIKGGTFVPRIDISLTDRFIYKRYRRDDGSYPRCARNMRADRKYRNLHTWADEQILLASQDAPQGISPSFWISVRMVYYIHTRVNLRLSE